MYPFSWNTPSGRRINLSTMSLQINHFEFLIDIIHQNTLRTDTKNSSVWIPRPVWSLWTKILFEPCILRIILDSKQPYPCSAIDFADRWTWNLRWHMCCLITWPIFQQMCPLFSNENVPVTSLPLDSPISFVYSNIVCIEFFFKRLKHKLSVFCFYSINQHFG